MPKILVVDDEKSVRVTFEIFLSNAGHAVQTAPDGKSAIRIQREWQADLVITDIVMPEEDGLGFMQNLRKEFPDTKIIVISGASFEAGCHLRAAELMGAMRVIQKPVNKEKLLEIVGEQFKR